MKRRQTTGDRRRATGDGRQESDVAPSPAQDALGAYFKTVRACAALTPEEERALVLEYRRTRDGKLKRRLAEANLRFVVKVALSFKRERGKLADLVAEGNLGLLLAIDKFDPGKNVRFLTYAKYWILATIRAFIMRDKRLVKIGSTMSQRALFWSLGRTKTELRVLLGRDPAPREMADRLGARLADVEEMLGRLSAKDAVLPDPEDSRSADEGASPDEVLAGKEEVELVRRHVAAVRGELSPPMLEILDRRLMADEPASLAEIADSHGFSREYARQLEAKLKKKLAEEMTG